MSSELEPSQKVFMLLTALCLVAGIVVYGTLISTYILVGKADSVTYDFAALLTFFINAWNFVIQYKVSMVDDRVVQAGYSKFYALYLYIFP